MPSNQAPPLDEVKLCVDCISKAFLVDLESPEPPCATFLAKPTLKAARAKCLGDEWQARRN